MLGFLKFFVDAKGKQIGQDVVSAIVSLDPDTASKAQLQQMEADLDKAGQLLRKLRAEYEREVREAEEIEKRFDTMMTAGDVLQQRLAAASDAEKPVIEASIGKLLTQLEDIAPQVEQERQDVIEAQELIDETQNAYKEKAQALLTAKRKLDRAKNDMRRAQIQEERAKEKAQRAAEVAGLREGSGDKLNVAVDAMRKQADEARDRAEAAKLKTLVLGKAAAAENDPNIASAMRVAESGGAGGGDFAQRLAALRKDKPLQIGGSAATPTALPGPADKTK